MHSSEIKIDSTRIMLPSFARTVVLESVGSTNAYAREQLLHTDAVFARRWGELSLIATANQRAGRGRLERVWSTPAGSALAVSMIVRPHANPAYRINPQNLHWLTQILSLAALETLAGYGVQPTIKWPNDVLVGEKKGCGVLSQLVVEPDGHLTVVAGIGLNLNMVTADLPVETATSLYCETGSTVSLTETLNVLGENFARLCQDFLGVGADPGAPLLGGLCLIERTRQNMSTLGKRVTVHLPGDQTVRGEAMDINDDGEILVRENGGTVRAFAVGDVVHLRPAAPAGS